MATKYDPTVIQEFADRLYAQADQVVLLYGVAGFVLGGGVGAAIGLSSAGSPIGSGLFIAGAFCVIFALIGRARSFSLRLQAQTSLCQAQIEFNTRFARPPG